MIKINLLNFKIISEIFSGFLANTSISYKFKDKLYYLIESSIQTNKKLWNLEDDARMIDLGSEDVAHIKQEIDKANQLRNDLVGEIDVEVIKFLKVVFSNSAGQLYNESPGMIIDRLAISFIKLSAIRELLSVITEEDLRQEYSEKEEVISAQITSTGNFLDSYLTKLKQGKVFFHAQQPVKIYNDTRIKKYIKLLRSQKNNL